MSLPDDASAEEIRRAIDELDRAWIRERAALLASDDGETSVPTMTEALLIAVLGGGLGVGWTAVTLPSPVFVAGILITGGSVAFAIATAVRAGRFERAETAWRAKRDPLARRLDALEPPDEAEAQG